jgi:hypothetical protein
MDSPSVSKEKRLKRRSSSMFNLNDKKQMDHENDLILTKQQLIRKQNLARRNYRDKLIVKNRQIDTNNILYEENLISCSDMETNTSL